MLVSHRSLSCALPEHMDTDSYQIQLPFTDERWVLQYVINTKHETWNSMIFITIGSLNSSGLKWPYFPESLWFSLSWKPVMTSQTGLQKLRVLTFGNLSMSWISATLQSCQPAEQMELTKKNRLFFTELASDYIRQQD